MKHNNAPFAKNDIIELEICDIASDGNGVGKYEGIAVFVPCTAVGDIALVRIVKLASSCAFGRLEQLLTPSPDRCENECPVYPKCGGCALRHISYEAEARIKRRWINDAMHRIGGFDIEVEEFIAADSPDRSRCKAQLPCTLDEGKVRFGFYARRSHRVIACPDCLLAPAEFAPIVRDCEEFFARTGNRPYDELTGRGRIRHLYLRRSAYTGEISLCVVVNAGGIEREAEFVSMIRDNHPEVSGIVINSNRKQTNVILGDKFRTAWGKGTLTDRLCGVDFEVSPRSFFQVNPPQAERLYRRAALYAGLDGSQTVIDLYCGAGTIGLTMASGAKQIIGVEEIPQAVENARANAAASGVENARFICADAGEAALRLESEGIRPDVVVLDPPRKGCSQEVVETVVRMAPERVVYVSCEPATLARDAARFAGLGYTPTRVTGVDMFPRTANVETVVLLSRE